MEQTFQKWEYYNWGDENDWALDDTLTVTCDNGYTGNLIHHLLFVQRNNKFRVLLVGLLEEVPWEGSWLGGVP